MTHDHSATNVKLTRAVSEPHMHLLVWVWPFLSNSERALIGFDWHQSNDGKEADDHSGGQVL